MKQALTFSDVLIQPKFSSIVSRKDVDLSHFFAGEEISLPVISANMDTITGVEMAKTLAANGAKACLHRFMSIEANVAMFKETKNTAVYQCRPWVSIGLGETELVRAHLLYEEGASVFFIDVAHGAQHAVVEQVKAVRRIIGPPGWIVVGNFATAQSVQTFLEHVGTDVDGIKVGIGPGAMCTTREVTGCGYPQLSAIMEIAEVTKKTGLTIIADGGMKTSGDIAKALAAGAHMVMLGSMLSGTDETPGEKRFYCEPGANHVTTSKRYRGSASNESYEAQGKASSWRTAEGEATWVESKGPVGHVLQQIEAGLKSALSYVGARNLEEFHNNAEFVQITNAGIMEGKAHGVKV